MNNKTLNNILVNEKLLENQGEIDNTIIISVQNTNFSLWNTKKTKLKNMIWRTSLINISL